MGGETDRQTETERDRERETEKAGNIVFYAQSTITVISGGQRKRMWRQKTEEAGQRRLEERQPVN